MPAILHPLSGTEINGRTVHATFAKGPQYYPLSNALARSGKTAAFEEGPRAYALHQASVRHCLFSMLAQRWHDVPAFVAMADRGLAEEVAIDNTMPVHGVISSCYLRFAECFNHVLMRDLAVPN
jgi:hypothetical protein